MKLLSAFICVILMLFQSGCTQKNEKNENHGKIENPNNYSTESYGENFPNPVDAMRRLGQGQKKIKENKSLEAAAITVNGDIISKSAIEMAKLQVEVYGNYAIPINQQIETLIKNKVLDMEAERLGITCSWNEVDEYIENQKKLFNYEFPPELQAYAQEMGLTESEYYESSKQSVYKTIVRNKVWLDYKKKNEIQIEREAEKRGIPIEDIAAEYRNEYENNLIKKADIEILDDEVRNLMDNAQENPV